MLKQPPCISSSEILRVRAFSDSCDSSIDNLRDVLRVGVANHRHEQAAIGIDRDADVHVLLVDDLVGRQIDRRVELREDLERGGDDLHRDRP